MVSVDNVLVCGSLRGIQHGSCGFVSSGSVDQGSLCSSFSWDLQAPGGHFYHACLALLLAHLVALVSNTTRNQEPSSIYTN